MGLVNCPACGSPVSTAAAACPRCAHPMAAPAPAAPRMGAAPAPGGDGISTLIPYTNPVALVGYYLGVFGLIPCLGIPLSLAAVFCGVAGLRNVRRNPQRKGTGHAWAAIILGTLSALGQVGTILFFILSKK